MRTARRSALLPLASLAIPAALAMLFAGCSQAPARQSGPPVVPVKAVTASLKDVPFDIRAIGTVEAYSTVDIRAQVGGVLEDVHFREGQDVRRGDLLFKLDARPYQAALESAQASLARDSAQLKTAKQDVERNADLVKKDYVTQEEFDQMQTKAETLEAAVRADKAAIDKATVDLDYCTIRSPIDGRTGQLMVHAGNLVKANSDNPLLTINKITPIYVAFSVPERDLSEIRAKHAQGKLEVRATVPDGSAETRTGDLTFIDNTADRSTGTVRLKATFANKGRAFWPGQFVDVSLQLGVRSGAVVVPTQAIQTGQSGPFVFVVKDDKTVDSRPVTPGDASDGFTVVEKGVSAGETVVTDGQLLLVPGMHVAIQPEGGEAAKAQTPAAAAGETTP